MLLRKGLTVSLQNRLCKVTKKRMSPLPKSRGEVRSDTGVAATTLEGKLVKGE